MQYTTKIFSHRVFILSAICFLFFSSCGMSKEDKINKNLLKDSLQYEQTKILKKSNKEVLEIDTAMNNANSKDPAIPVFDEED